MSNNNNGGRRDRRDGYPRGEHSDGHFSVHISDDDYARDAQRGRGGYSQERHDRRPQQQYDRGERRPPQQRPQGGRGYDDRRYEAPARERRDAPQRYDREAPARARPAQENNHGCLKTFLYAVFVLSVSALLSFGLITGFNDMLGLVKDDVQITVKIPSDADLDTVAHILGEESVVNHPTLFKWYSKYTNREDYIPGTFELSAKSDYDRIIRILTSHYPLGQQTVTVTIPEGLNLMQIADVLDKAYVCSKDQFFATLEARKWKHEFIKSVPQRKASSISPMVVDYDVSVTQKNIQKYINAAHPELKDTPVESIIYNRTVSDSELTGQKELRRVKISQAEINRYRNILTIRSYTYRLEGYLFPATYEFYIEGSAVYNINRMLNAFDYRVLTAKSVGFSDKLTALNESQGERIGQTIDMDFVITMASVIEREAQTPEDMKTVASVFYNRLAGGDSDGIGGRLESDATMWYPFPTEKEMRKSDMLTEEQKNSFAQNNPYNTHNIKGLPPGPICCPGLNAINAVLEPASTKYYYFFSDKDGKFHFAENYSKFTDLLNKYGS